MEEAVRGRDFTRKIVVEVVPDSDVGVYLSCCDKAVQEAGQITDVVLLRGSGAGAEEYGATALRCPKLVQCKMEHVNYTPEHCTICGRHRYVIWTHVMYGHS